MVLDIGIEIPDDHVTQKCSVMGVTGTGKSYAIGVILEEYCKKDLPFVCVDVLGAHYGLAEKYVVTILGGQRGQKISYDQGELIANQIWDFNIRRVIIDMHEWNDYEMQDFMTAFLRTLFGLHGIKRKPRHVFVEEAEVFAPQQGYDHSKYSLLQMNKVMKRGRALGLGMSLISQRPQDLNKKTLSQCQGNFILHMEGIHEMEVVAKILKNETKDTRDDLLAKVASAQKGECMLYAPQWIGDTQFFKFRKREAFHAGYTPEEGKEVIEPQLTHKQDMPMINKEEEDPEKKEKEKKRDRRVLAYAVIFGVVLYLISVLV